MEKVDEDSKLHVEWHPVFLKPNDLAKNRDICIDDVLSADLILNSLNEILKFYRQLQRVASANGPDVTIDNLENMCMLFESDSQIEKIDDSLSLFKLTIAVNVDNTQENLE